MMMPKYIEDDIVKYNDKIMVIKEPRDGSHFDLFCPQEGLVYCLVDVEEIKPIPITVEILEKNGWKIEDVNPNDLSNIVSYGIMYRAIKDKEILFFHKGASVFTCPLNWRRIEIRFVHQLQHLLFGLGLNHKMEV